MIQLKLAQKCAQTIRCIRKNIKHRKNHLMKTNCNNYKKKEESINRERENVLIIQCV